MKSRGTKISGRSRLFDMSVGLTFSLFLMSTPAAAAPEEKECKLTWQRGYETAYWLVEGTLRSYPNMARRDARYAYTPDMDGLTFDIQALHLNRLANWYYLNGDARLLAVINDRLTAFYQGAISSSKSTEFARDHYRAALRSQGPALHYFQEWEISGRPEALERSITRLKNWRKVLRSEFGSQRISSSNLMLSGLLLAQSLVASGGQNEDLDVMRRGLTGFESLAKSGLDAPKTFASRGAISRFRAPLEHAIARLTLASTRRDYRAFAEPLEAIRAEMAAIDPDCDYVNHARAFYYLSYYELERAEAGKDFEELKRLSLAVGRRIDFYDSFPAFRPRVLDLFARIEGALTNR